MEKDTILPCRIKKAGEEGDDQMELMEAITQRRSIRKYKPDPVPKEKIMRILEAANWAPSGRDGQQWEYMVVGGEIKDQLAGIYSLITEENMPPEEERTKRQRSFSRWAKDLGGAPLVVVAVMRREVDPASYKMVLESVAASFQNLLLAAHDEGLGTCWMTGPLRAEQKVNKVLKLPKDLEVVAMTPLGYPDSMPKAPDRHDPDLKEKLTLMECDQGIVEEQK